MKYSIIKLFSGSDGAYLSGLPSEGPKDYEYSKGISLLDRHPKGEDAEMFFDPDYPDKIVLNDFLDNLDSLLIGNSKVREVLEGLDIKNIEYLPIRVMDHKDKLASSEYFILNVLGGVDVIDMENSEFRMGNIIKTQIKWIDDLSIDYENIPEDAKFFRASMKLDQFFIRDDVKEAFEASGLTGYKVFDADGWDGLD